MVEEYRPWIEYQREGQDADEVVLPRDLQDALFSGDVRLSRREAGLETVEHRDFRDDV